MALLQASGADAIPAISPTARGLFSYRTSDESISGMMT
jgi:hypothetical protein